MALRALIERADVKNGIVFCNRKSEVDIVAKSLKTHGLDAAPIHGDLDQSDCACAPWRASATAR